MILPLVTLVTLSFGLASGERPPLAEHGQQIHGIEAKEEPKAKAKEGKDLFIEFKCVMCHSAEAAGVESRKKGKPIDLPGPGGTYEPTWIKAYLLKSEKIEERTHPTLLKAEEQDQATLVDWVCALKPKKK